MTTPTTTPTTVTKKAKKPLNESISNDIAGFGNNVVKLTESGIVLAYIGMQDGHEKVYFPKPVTSERLESVYEFMQKKKFNKFITNEQFDKAQEFADRKFDLKS